MTDDKDDFYWSMIKPDKALDYKIVQGLPTAVEHEVKMLLAQDWELNGELMKMKIQDNDIVIQSMVLYKKHMLC